MNCKYQNDFIGKYRESISSLKTQENSYIALNIYLNHLTLIRQSSNRPYTSCLILFDLYCAQLIVTPLPIAKMYFNNRHRKGIKMCVMRNVNITKASFHLALTTFTLTTIINSSGIGMGRFRDQTNNGHHVVRRKVCLERCGR